MQHSPDRKNFQFDINIKSYFYEKIYRRENMFLFQNNRKHDRKNLIHKLKVKENCFIFRFNFSN